MHLVSVVVRQANVSIFVDGSARRYSLWDPYPWIPFSAFADVRPGYEGEFHSNCLPRWDLGDGTELRLSKDMIQVSSECLQRLTEMAER